MRNLCTKRRARFFSFLFIILFISEIGFPTFALALTSGPSQPEFSSFEPVATTSMVNEFSGDLTYNLPVLDIPGSDGGGYSMSLSYHSGGSTEEEASWVGYGWTLNPGSINRGMKGLADDWKDVTLKKWNKSKRNKTATVAGALNFEIYSIDPGLNLNGALRYNNYKGFGYQLGAGLSLGAGVVSLGYNISDGEGSFSLRVNPAALMNRAAKKGKEKRKEIKDAVDQDIKKQEVHNTLLADKAKQRNSAKSARLKPGSITLIGSNFGLLTSGSVPKPSYVAAYDGASYTFSGYFQGTPTPLQLGVGGSVTGTYAWQENEAYALPSAYGYMYNAEAPEGNTMMDYQTEKLAPFKKNDFFLPIPVGSADSYSATGEGMAGGFKLHHKTPGHYFPNGVVSSSPNFQIGAEFEAGLNFGGGANIGAGNHKLEVGKWSDPEGDFTSTSALVDEPVHFRFTNDLGGAVSYGTTSPQRASLNDISGALDEDYEPLAPEFTSLERPGRSSFIGYNKNLDMEATSGNGTRYKAYNKNDDVNSFINRTSSHIKDQIGEIAMYNEDGNQYVYGLPVYSKEETNVTIGLEGTSVTIDQNKYADLSGYTGNFDSYETVNGQESATPYATSYLLTEITTPDYIDLNNNGPDDMDFGGWTKFNYERVHGSTNKESSSDNNDWYKWRTPYNGMMYNRNSLSSSGDDIASVSFGLKEIYYLETIETKTHIAVFHKSLRDDGREAHHSESLAGDLNSNNMGPNKLEKLDKIELYIKNDLGAPGDLVKTVHFEYDYSTCSGVPNNSNGTGKLTLKRVYFETNGIVNAYIAPYEFGYEYPTITYPSPYESLSAEPYSLSQQNPPYSPFNVDAWGNYQKEGNLRFDKLQNWVNQTPPDSFDPAAWQLKTVTLPSGGEIHIQYEQDEYRYVQDQRAHAMVSLVNPGSETFTIDSETDLGITDPALISNIVEEMHERYVLNEEKIYFKFLYQLIGSGPVDIDVCNSEYIDGYADVESVNQVGNNIELSLASGGYTLPSSVCQDYVKTQRAGNLSESGNCDPSTNGIADSSDPETILYNLINFIGVNLGMTNTCAVMNPDLSYFRIPVADAKKGGGIRVKRILMYDNGLSTNSQASLFGSEYIYDTIEDGLVVSSGVATNEPGSIREENILVGYLKQFDQSDVSRIISGRDKRQAEGPFGESLLPGPAVGYSRIAIKNIHSGKTNVGFSVSEYITAKDYPFYHEKTSVNQETEFLPLPGGIINKFINNIWATQGYTFHLNSMHGQMKSRATYAGDYSLIHDPNSAVLTSLQATEYFEPGEGVPVLKDVSVTNPDYFDIEDDVILGQEMEVSMETRFTRDTNDSGTIEGDIDGGIFFGIPVPMLSAFPSATFTRNSVQTHVTTKVISHPVIKRSTLAYQDGVYHQTFNTVFNQESGKPVVTESFDGYRSISDLASNDFLDLLHSNQHDGRFINRIIPSSIPYESMGQKAANESKVVNAPGVNIDLNADLNSPHLTVSLTSSFGDVCGVLNSFCPGDLIEVQPNSGIGNGYNVYHVDNVSGNVVNLQNVSYSTLNYDISNSIVRILRSGKTNQLNSQASSIVQYVTDPTEDLVDFNSIYNIADREALANLLNGLLNSPIGTSVSLDDINVGLSVAGSDCDQYTEGLYATLSAGPTISIDQWFTNTTVIGTPSSPHPMVDALNDYLDTYFNFDLSGSPNQVSYCSTPVWTGQYFQTANNSNSQVGNMRNLQTNDLNQTFNFVNGTTQAISDLIEDDGFALGYTDATYNQTTQLRKNLRVLLVEQSTGLEMGASAVCGENPSICYGCNDKGRDRYCMDYGKFLSRAIKKKQVAKKAKQTAPEPQNNDIGQFVQNGNGYLCYEFPVYNGESVAKKRCCTDIRFFRETEGHVNKICHFPYLSQEEISTNSGGLDGEFVINPENGSLEFVYDDYPCSAVEFNCIQFCDEDSPDVKLLNVVKTSASTFDDQWDYTSYLGEDLSDMNEYERGTKGKWRANCSYSYRESIKGLDGTSLDSRAYNSGTFTLNAFNFNNEIFNSSKWLKANDVLRYSENGRAIEEENVLGIISSAKFGYDKTVPYLTVSNSEYTSAHFESFEKEYDHFITSDVYFEDGLLYDISKVQRIGIAHSGKSGLKLIDGNKIDLNKFIVTDHLMSVGLKSNVWVYADLNHPDDFDDRMSLKVNNVSTNSLVASYQLDRVAQVGEWILYEISIEPEDLLSSSNSELQVSLEFNMPGYGNSQVVIDDFKIQPKDAKMSTYVYDPDYHRLIATFDDQHFGLYYQYNSEGQLSRKLMETEKGMKTVTETQYNTPLKARTQ